MMIIMIMNFDNDDIKYMVMMMMRSMMKLVLTQIVMTTIIMEMKI